MRTMSGGPCLHYDCSNRNSFGYCKTTVCINEHYQQEQWGLPSSTYKCETVVIKQQTKTKTNRDKMRAMSDEELAKIIGDNIDCKICKKMNSTDGLCPGSIIIGELDCYGVWLKWLKAEVE